jgi:hypothetical protein
VLISDLAVNPFGLANKIEAQTAPQTTIIRMKEPKIGRRGLDLQVVSMGTSPETWKNPSGGRNPSKFRYSP